MLKAPCSVTVPDELNSYYLKPDLLEPDESISASLTAFTSNIVINRNNNGSIEFVNYYSGQQDLVKTVFYGENNEITRTNYYRNNRLYYEEKLKNGVVENKIYYDDNENITHSIEYEYNRKGLISSICKNCANKSLKVSYEYDDIERIIRKTIYQDNKLFTNQEYCYDILNRIIQYKDDKQLINVQKVNSKNELLKYTITDKIGNNITIENVFSPFGYSHTNVTVNEHTSKVKNTSYVDNVMLKRPYTSEDDLDLIIASLFDNPKTKRVMSIEDSERRSNHLINENIEVKALPISLRKRLLYNQVVSA